MINRTMIFFFGCVFSYVAALDSVGFVGLFVFVVLHVVSERDLESHFKMVGDVCRAWKDRDNQSMVFQGKLIRAIKRIHPDNITREN